MRGVKFIFDMVHEETGEAVSPRVVYEDWLPSADRVLEDLAKAIVEAKDLNVPPK